MEGVVWINTALKILFNIYKIQINAESTAKLAYIYELVASLKDPLLQMSNQIKSQVLGQLTQEENFPDWWKSENVPVPLFDGRKLPFIFMDFEPDTDMTFMSEADEALTNFFALDRTYRESISHRVYKNYKDFLEAIEYDEADQAMVDMKQENEIWQFVHPSEIYVTRRPYQEQDIYVQIACECDWE